MQLARFRTVEELALDLVHVGHAAPQAVEAHRAVFEPVGGPVRFRIAQLEMRGGAVQRFAAIGQFGIERACQRHRLDQVGIVFARHEAEQVPHPEAMRDQFGQFARPARAARGLQHAALQALFGQIAIVGGLILEIDFRFAARHLVERRLRDEEVPGLHDLGHLAVEEGQQQGADMRAVDIGVGHDDDLVIAQFVEREFVAQARTHRLDQRADFLRGNDPVEPGALHVQDLALQRQDRLRLAVAALLGGTARGITLDQEEFAIGGIAILAIGQLAGQRSDAHRALAAHFAGTACGLARGGGVDDLLDDRLGVVGVFLQPFAHLLAHQRFQGLADFGGNQLVLGLRSEFGIGQLDRNDRGQPFAHIFARERDLFLLHQSAGGRVIVERAGQRGAEGCEVRAAVALRDVVGEGEDVLVIAVVPLQRDVDPDPVLFRAHRDRFGDERLLVAVEIFDEGRDSAFVEQVVLQRFLVPVVAQFDAHAGIEESELAIAVLQLVEIELGHVLERVLAGLEGDARPLLQPVLVAV